MSVAGHSQSHVNAADTVFERVVDFPVSTVDSDDPNMVSAALIK